jgi:hypothetical protein
MRRRLLVAVLVAGSIAVPAAHADGDPASDYLLSQDTFLPFDASISNEQAAQLNTVVADAKKKGFTVKVAVIAKPFDLGAVPSLYGKPKTYALPRPELSASPRGLLIVIPKGRWRGAASRCRARSECWTRCSTGRVVQAAAAAARAGNGSPRRTACASRFAGYSNSQTNDRHHRGIAGDRAAVLSLRSAAHPPAQ